MCKSKGKSKGQSIHINRINAKNINKSPQGGGVSYIYSQKED
jgi:hypothetical protein